MTDAQKLSTLKVLLEDGSGYMPSDQTLTTYIKLSESEILSWMYHLVGGVPDSVDGVPDKYETIQIYAVLAGLTPGQRVRPSPLKTVFTGTSATRICSTTFTTTCCHMREWVLLLEDA